MTHVTFEWAEPAPLVEYLTVPIVGASIRLRASGEPYNVTLWRPDGDGIDIFTRPFEISEWNEVGYLAFRIAEARSAPVNDDPEYHFDLPTAFLTPPRATKLWYSELGATVEAGIEFESEGQRITIVPGLVLFTVAVTGTLTTDYPFKPERPLDTYSRTTMLE